MWKPGTRLPFGRYFLNTILVATIVTACVLLTSVLAAYAFANIAFPGKNLIFILILATMMIPHEAGYIPNFVIVRTLGWYNQYPALIIPWTASAFNIFLLRQFFASLPADLWGIGAARRRERLALSGAEIAVPLGGPRCHGRALQFVGS